MKIPMVVRMIGTNEKQAQEVLKKNGIQFLTDSEKAAMEVVSLA